MIVAIIGGTGFIGGYLVDLLVNDSRVEQIRLLSRGWEETTSKKVEIFNGNVFDKASLKGLLVEGAVVVNLAYLAEEEQSKNLELIHNVVQVCRECKINKFIHVSTAVVAGRAKASLVTEETVATPFSEYDKTKLLVEGVLLRDAVDFEVVILRPTAVFGPGGKNLVSLVTNLYSGSIVRNYLKSCLYGERTMNLVSVENVVSALHFLVFANKDLDRQIFIVSEDAVPSNNYIGVERIVQRVLGVSDYPIPRVLLPDFFLKIILILVGKSNVDANRRYSSENLESLGWVRSQDFENKVEQFAEWQKKGLDN